MKAVCAECKDVFEVDPSYEVEVAWRIKNGKPVYDRIQCVIAVGRRLVNRMKPVVLAGPHGIRPECDGPARLPGSMKKVRPVGV